MQDQGLRRILFLTSFDPGRITSGGSVRSQNILRLLADLARVDVVLANAHQEELTNAQVALPNVDLLDVFRLSSTPRLAIAQQLRHEFDRTFLNAFGFQATAAQAQKVQTLLTDYDVVWIQGLRVANAFGIWRWPHSVLDVDDVQSAYYRTIFAQRSGLMSKARALRQILLWRRREKTLASRFDQICVCTEADREYLAALIEDGSKIHVLPNGFRRPDRPPTRNVALPPRIGFVGNFYHTPNRHGLRWFVEKVWPAILQAAPETRLRIAGPGSETENWGRCSNTDILGLVEDMESEMSSWALTVVPVLVGGGTRVKIVEAFSRKCPVVTTSLGLHGYEARDAEDLLVANSPAEFAAKCLLLLADPGRGEALAENAWQKFLRCWTWDSYATRLAGIVNQVHQMGVRTAAAANT